MKISTLLVCLLVAGVSTSCMKEYTCVCTKTATGEIENGDKFRSGPLRKDAFEKTCESTNVTSLGTLENCHLE